MIKIKKNYEDTILYIIAAETTRENSKNLVEFAFF
jgi:hypothetical protein